MTSTLITAREASHIIPDNKVYGANTGPTWGRQDPGGPQVGPMNLTVWEYKKWQISHCEKRIF